MNFLYELYVDVVTFVERGGEVLYLIAILCCLMWALIVERFYYFSFEHRQLMSHSIDDWNKRSDHHSWLAHQVRAALLSRAREKIQGSLPLVTTCVALCPLLGLLGTVTGMIAVFDAMATQGGNARSMAAGVSRATIPTMAGMVASLSGVFALTYLKRQADTEIEFFESHVSVADPPSSD